MAAPSVSLRDSYALDYKRADYNEQNRDRTLHFLIALNQPIQTIQKYCAKFPATVHAPDKKNNQFRPLSLAVICGRQDVAQSLLQAKADPLAQDAFGFTAMHHAALLPDQATLNLLTKSVNQVGLNQIRCQFGGTWQDVRKLVRGPVIPPDEMIGSYDGDNLTAEGFKNLTGAEFCKKVHTSPEILLKYHQKKANEIDEPSLQADDPLIARFEKSPPRLSLTKEDAEMGIGVRTEQNLKKGEIVRLYEAELIDQGRPSPLDFRIGILDAFKKRGVASCINDGPPNCYTHSITNLNGVPQQIAILTTTPVGAKSLLHYNYGWKHPIKMRRYILTDQMIGTLHDFFKKHSFMELSKKMKEEELHEAQMMLYLVDTPAAFIRLLLDGTIRHKEVENFLKDQNSPLIISPIFNHLLLTINCDIALIKRHTPQLVASLIELQKETTVYAYCQALKCIRHLSYNEINSKNFCENFIHFGKIAQMLAEGSQNFEDEKKTDEVTPLISKLSEGWKERVEDLKECLK